MARDGHLWDDKSYKLVSTSCRPSNSCQTSLKPQLKQIKTTDVNLMVEEEEIVSGIGPTSVQDDAN